jgi:hypothetical protein
VRAPAALIDRPYLRPVYDEPEFVVRNIWRFYGGWWDGNPATLKPAPEAALAAELAELAGGASTLADRALALAQSAVPGADRANGGADPTISGADGPAALRVAAHLAELAALAAPTDPGVHRVRARVFTLCAEAATSTMAKGVFNWAARESEGHLGEVS